MKYMAEIVMFKMKKKHVYKAVERCVSYYNPTKDPRRLAQVQIPILQHKIPSKTNQRSGLTT